MNAEMIVRLLRLAVEAISENDLVRLPDCH